MRRIKKNQPNRCMFPEEMVEGIDEEGVAKSIEGVARTRVEELFGGYTPSNVFQKPPLLA
jgi:hypothetical protein